MNKAIPSAAQHNLSEFHKLIKDFLSNDLEGIEEVLMSSLADHVSNEDYDADYRKMATRSVGDVLTFISKLKTRYGFLSIECKEVGIS